ncbi:MAG TPA: asparaginase domain-containing protein [Patescibacteria group bacterium]|nr:asparaginase domain-containing protein [Patescibacteria group bacterium]
MNGKKIHLILTGGRIDSVWDGNVDEVVLSEHSVIPDYLKKIDVAVEFVVTEVSMKDSRALTSDDREKIREAIDESETSKILVTHGTHTLPDTVEFLQENLQNKDKTIVFTGSSTPLKDFALTDAGFNLGYAIAMVQQLPAGIYYCNKGTTITDREMRTQLVEGKFYTRS